MPVNPEALREFAERYTAAWCSQNPAAVAACYAPGGSLTVNDGAPAVGREAITEVARSFMTAFPDMQVLLDDLIVPDGPVEYHWTLVGTNTGPGGAGKRVRIRGVERWQLDADGRIAQSRGSFDSAEYQRQLERGADQAE